MWKIVTVLVLTALAIFAARLAQETPFAVPHHSSAVTLEAGTTASVTPPLMYAGIRG